MHVHFVRAIEWTAVVDVAIVVEDTTVGAFDRVMAPMVLQASGEDVLVSVGNGR